MMPQSAWILITACAKPALPLEDCHREYGRVTRSASPQRSRYTRPSSFPPSCTMQRPGLSIEKKVGLQEWFHQRCLRSIFGIKWQDHFSNEEVVKRASLPSIESILLQVQLRWDGHVTRMEDARMPKAVFFSELQEGERDRGTKKALQRSAEETVCTGGNQPSVMTARGLRPRQLALISEFPHCCKFETERHETAKERRRKQKEQAASLSS